MMSRSSSDNKKITVAAGRVQPGPAAELNLYTLQLLPVNPTPAGMLNDNQAMKKPNTLR